MSDFYGTRSDRLISSAGEKSITYKSAAILRILLIAWRIIALSLDSADQVSYMWINNRWFYNVQFWDETRIEKSGETAEK